MKSIIISLLIIMSTKAISQTKGDNAILIKGVGFLEVCNMLLDSGNVIENKDNELQTAITAPRQYPKYWNATYKIHIRVKDSIAYIGSTYTAPPEGGLFRNEPTEYLVNKKGKPANKSLSGYAFVIIDWFAAGFNIEVQYKKN